MTTDTTDRDGNRVLPTVLQITVAVAITIVGLFGIALIHLVGAPEKFADTDTAYQGVLFIALMVACGLAAMGLVVTGRPFWFAVSGLVAAATIAAFVISRTTGLPHAADDVGAWGGLLGLASLFVEGVVVVTSAYGFALARRWPSPAPRSTAEDLLDLSMFDDSPSLVASSHR